MPGKLKRDKNGKTSREGSARNGSHGARSLRDREAFVVLLRSNRSFSTADHRVFYLGEPLSTQARECPLWVESGHELNDRNGSKADIIQPGLSCLRCPLHGAKSQ